LNFKPQIVINLLQLQSLKMATPAPTVIKPTANYIHLVFVQVVSTPSSGFALGPDECIFANPKSIVIPTPSGGLPFQFTGKDIRICLEQASILGYELVNQSSTYTPHVPNAFSVRLSTTVILRKAV
jgi:hypothetical protein